MSNQAQIVFHLPLLIVFGILLGDTLSRGRKRIWSNRGALVLLCLFVWQIVEFMQPIVPDGFWGKYIFTLRFIPLTYLPVSFLYSTFSFYRIKNVLPKWIDNVIFIPPALTTVVALISVSVNLIVSDFQSVTQYTYGFWYYIYFFFSFAAYALIGCILIYNFRTLPKAYRRGSAFHALYFGLFLLVQLVCRVLSPQISFDLYYIGLSVCGLLFYLANVLRSEDSSLNIDQNNILDFLDQAVFILNKDGAVVDTNRPANLWLKSLKRSVENVSFDGLLAVLSNNNRIEVKKLEDSEDSDVHITGTAVPMIYRMERRSFTAGDGISQGEFITLTDVTRNRLLIDRLRDMAGVDGLTGVANRYRYQDLLRKLDRAENYPFAVVIGDVNGLKYVNDNFGHSAGDEYLKDIASVMQSCCPDGGYVARYGGDEFAALLPQCTRDEAETYIHAVHAELKKPRPSGRKPSISLGCAIKYHGNENLNALIAEADRKMYDEKQAQRREQPV